MNSDPNSDSKQCTKSKLGRVHSVHTLNPSLAHAALTAPRSRARRALGAVLWPHPALSQAVSCRVTAPTRALARRVTASGPTVSQPPLPVATQNLCHDTTLAARVATFLRRVVGHYCVVLRHRRSPPATIQNLYRNSPPAARPRPLVAAHPARRPAVL